MADLTGEQYPSSPSFTSVGFSITTPTIASETNAGKIRRVGYGHSYYSWQVKYPPMTARDAGVVTGFAARAFGNLYSFEIVLPEISYSKAISQATGANTSTSGALPSGSISVTLSGCGNNKEVLRAGDFFKFNNHSKVYMCAVHCNSNGSGTATLYFSGATVAAVPSGTALTIDAVPFTAVFVEGIQEYEVGMGGMTVMSANMREVR
jgi:hypothetical protein